MRNHKLLFRLSVALAIGIYALTLTRAALLSYFNPDACENIYRSWYPPLTSLLKANLLFFLNSSFYRPLGSVWYRAIYDLAGFNPVPFTIADLLVVSANIWLTYSVCRQLTDSREVGALGALLFAYHSSFRSLYFDIGFVYDVLCYFFYFSALLLYIRIRKQRRPLVLWELIACSALYICALNSKEIAVTFPAALAIYEWLYQRVPFGSLRGFWRWPLTYSRTVLVTVFLTVLFIIGRSLGSDSLLTMSAYRPVVSWRHFMVTSQGFLNGLIFRPETPVLHSIATLLIWLVLFVIAWVSKVRALRFAWLFIILSPLPVAFLNPPRGCAQYYVPFFGWVLYASTALVLGTRRMFGKNSGPLFARMREVTLFVVVLAVMFHLNIQTDWSGVPAVAMEGELYRSIVGQVHQLRPNLRKGARLLFLDDPSYEHYHHHDRYNMLFLMLLSYKDRSLVVDLAQSWESPPSAAQIATYDCVFDYRLGRFFPSVRQEPRGPEPAVFLDWGRPDFFHVDWTRVDRRHPAKRGEQVFSLMVDLGDTKPVISNNQPFPSSPLLEVASPVEVRVDRQPAEIQLKIGDPGAVNRYRVDFRVPKDVRSGAQLVEVTCRGKTGPTTEIAIQ